MKEIGNSQNIVRPLLSKRDRRGSIYELKLSIVKYILTNQTAAKTTQSLSRPMIFPLRPRRIKFVHRISLGSGAKAVLRTFGFQHVMPCAHNCADFHDLYMRHDET
jgi:hypothetical protein